MNFNNANYSSSHPSKIFLEWILVVLSSVLLGIWAVKNTIALRNILLVSGALFSVYYIVHEWRHGQLKEQFMSWKGLPILLLALIFFWVVSHYLFFSVDPVQQFQELVSTWLRAFIASLVGLATGLALRKHPNRLNLLWLGIFIAYLVLFYQYTPRALSQKKLFVPDYDSYLFHLKINAVLTGTILIAGVNGALLDHLRTIYYRWSNLTLWYLLYWLLSVGFSLWAFVFIINTRNGIGLAIILYSFWLISTLVFFIQNRVRPQSIKSVLAFLIFSFGLCLILYFTFVHISVNSGWNTLFKDAKIAVQIDRYPHWQNLAKMGFPKHDDGQFVSYNTYERIAWATAGSGAIIGYPIGVGLLAYPFAKHPNSPPLMEVGPSGFGIATHSGWIELGLAFGIPILVLISSILFLTLIESARHPYPAKMTVLFFTILISCLYAVSEVTIQHGIEILFFFLALLPALLLTKTEHIGLND